MPHLHLDPLGGIAGDMFAAAMLNAFPDLAGAAIGAAEALSGAACTLDPHSDGTLTGARFTVAAGAAPHHHHHAHWGEIRRRIAGADLPARVRDHATGIFAELAAAEASVHGVAIDDVAFHEVGAADSIADIAAAAAIIAGLEPATWSVAPLPLGGGTVETAHGRMPVPAPATAILLQGLPVIDDGVGGERVTPTGAAILRYLRPATARPRGRLGPCGYGFGTRRLPGVPNCLRVLALETDEAGDHRDLAIITFEVDDQSGEDLAAGLDRLRATDGVHDVIQMAAIGKKGRFATHVQVLARPDALEAAVAACWAQTTTIGLRTQVVQARALPRRIAAVSLEDGDVRVKLAERPGGVTAKAEADDVRRAPSQAERAALRRRAEEAAL